MAKDVSFTYSINIHWTLDIQRWKDLVLSFHFVPYWREYVQSQGKSQEEPREVVRSSFFFFFFQSNILYHFSTVVRRKQETDFLLIMIICPLMNSYFSYPQLFPSSFQKQNCTPITQWVLYNLLWKFLGLHIPLEIIPKKGRLLLPNVSPGHQLLGLLLVSSSGTLLS